MTEENDVSIDVDEINESRSTEAAWFVKVDNKVEWCPKSLCRAYPKKKKIYMPQWLAEKKGLI